MKNEYTTAELKESKFSFNTQAKETNITLEKGVHLSNIKEFKSKDLFIDNGVNLLDSPTNSGKSHYVLNNYINNIESDEYIILIAPTLVLVDDLSSSIKAYGFKGNFDRKELEEKRILICVYNKLADLVKHQDDNFNLKKSHIFIDEAHNIYSSFDYRSKVMLSIDNLLFKKKQYKKLILMSGTFDNTLIEINNIVKVNRNFKITKKCNLIYAIKGQTLTDSCLTLVEDYYKQDNNRLQIIYQKSKQKLKDYALTLENKGIKCLVLSADTKLNEEVQGLLKNNYVDDDIKVLLMTNIGEEGISILNQNLYCTHTVGKINSASAEQLGNRGRKVEPILNIHLKYENESETKPLFIDVEKTTRVLKGRANSFRRDIEDGLYEYENREMFDFMNYCTWDKGSLLEFSNLTISFNIYSNNNKNEENLYRTIFIDNMKKYGWIFEVCVARKVVKVKIIKDNVTNKNLILEIFEGFNKNRDINGSKEDFIYINKDLCDITLLDKMFFRFTNTTKYFEDSFIIEQIKRMTRQNNTLDRLEEYIRVVLEDKKDNATKWLFDNIETDTIYTKEELEILTKTYNSVSKNKNGIWNNGYENVDVAVFKKIIKRFYITKDVRINKSRTVEKAYNKFKVIDFIKYVSKSK